MIGAGFDRRRHAIVEGLTMTDTHTHTLTHTHTVPQTLPHTNFHTHTLSHTHTVVEFCARERVAGAPGGGGRGGKIE